MARLLVLIASIALLPAPTMSQEVAKWGQVGGWRVLVDRTLGDGCFAMQVFERGSVLRIGFDVVNQRIYLFFGHDNWKSLEVGKVYSLRIVFDGGASSYNGEMKGSTIGDGGVVFLAHKDLSTAFVKDFMERTNMQVFYRGEQIGHLSLRNTYAAVTEVLNCQKELGFNSAKDPSTSTPAADPFAKSPRSSKDPFAR
jgi:hypothetical protein